MPRFRYTAIDPSSTTVNGRIEASSQSAVVDRLRAAGQMPLSIEQIGPFPSSSAAELAALFRRRMPRQTLTLITGQLATLLQAGLALDEGISGFVLMADDAVTVERFAAQEGFMLARSFIEIVAAAMYMIGHGVGIWLGPP